jgi:hypothetical protein
LERADFATLDLESSSDESPASSLSWPAVCGGALAAVALTAVLVALGAGLGFATVSPWPSAGASATSFGVAAAIWLVVVQWLSSAFGGYLTGRLRTRWVGVHDHEVFFRDTVNGFLSWALATVIGIAILGSSLGSLLGNATRSASAAATAGASVGAASGGGTTQAYLLDTLFRADGANAVPATPEVKAEAGRILIVAARDGTISQDDRTYLARVVAARTDLSQADSEKRVDAVVAKVKDAEVQVRAAADRARKAAISLAIYSALSLLIGAFIAAVAGALGGRDRDAWTAQLRGL